MQKRNMAALIATAIVLVAAAFGVIRSISKTQKASSERQLQLTKQADMVTSQMHEQTPDTTENVPADDAISISAQTEAAKEAISEQAQLKAAEKATSEPVQAEAAKEAVSEQAQTEAAKESVLIQTQTTETGEAVSSQTETEEITEAVTDESESMTENAADTYENTLCRKYPDDIVHAQTIIFVGDSRTVGMGYAEYDLGDQCFYIGESGEGFRWFIETGLEDLENTLRDHPHLPVIYNLGVNDPESIDSYIDLYKAIENEWFERDFYYLSVNPVEKDSIFVTDADIRRFNAQLKSSFPDRFIDSYTWMKKSGFETVDGIHYSELQYCRIHDYAIRGILSIQDAHL